MTTNIEASVSDRSARKVVSVVLPARSMPMTRTASNSYNPSWLKVMTA